MPWNFPLWQVVRFAAPDAHGGQRHGPQARAQRAGLREVPRGPLHARRIPEGVVHEPLRRATTRSPAIIADPRVAAVTLTGSERAGRSVAELAGQPPEEVRARARRIGPLHRRGSADMDLTVPMAVTARVQNNGQACIAAKRFIVVRERADEFIERFVDGDGRGADGRPHGPRHRARARS